MAYGLSKLRPCASSATQASRNFANCTSPLRWLYILHICEYANRARPCGLTTELTGAGARRAQGTNTGHENGEAMASVGVRVEPPVSHFPPAWILFLHRKGYSVSYGCEQPCGSWGKEVPSHSLRQRSCWSMRRSAFCDELQCMGSHTLTEN